MDLTPPSGSSSKVYDYLNETWVPDTVESMSESVAEFHITGESESWVPETVESMSESVAAEFPITDESETKLCEETQTPQEVADADCNDDGSSSKSKVEDGEILPEERDRILSSPISAQDASQLLISNHSYSVNDAGACNISEAEFKKLNLHPQREYNSEILCCQDDDCRAVTHCWDPDDPRTWKRFEGKHSFFLLGHISFRLYGEPLIGHPVFELYSVVFEKLDPKRDFSLIYMTSDVTSLVPTIIYKFPPEGKKEEIIGQTLPLKGPFLPPTPRQCIVISFTNSTNVKDRWCFTCGPMWCYNVSSDITQSKEKEDPVLRAGCWDKQKTSIATISYRISTFGVRAELSFIIMEEKDRDIYLTYGDITATDGTDSQTKRIIQKYSKEPLRLRSREKLVVNRSAFGVPMSSYLRVEVKLVFSVDKFCNQEKKIQGSLDFKIPSLVSTFGHVLATSDCSIRLLVETSWTNPCTDIPY